MAITFGLNIASLTAQRRLGEATFKVSNAFQQLSSGMRINSSSDDVADLAVALSLNSSSRLFAQVSRNINDGISLYNVVDSALSTQTNLLGRIQELANQSSNGVLSFTQRKAIDAEAQQLIYEFNRVASSTKFNGIDLLSGANNSVAIQVGATGGTESTSIIH